MHEPEYHLFILTLKLNCLKFTSTNQTNVHLHRYRHAPNKPCNISITHHNFLRFRPLTALIPINTAGVGLLALGRGGRRRGLLGGTQPVTLMAGVSQQQMAKVR